MKRIAILGSTGSIGRSTLSVVESYPDRFEVAALAAGSNVEATLEQARRWKPRVLSLANERDAHTVQARKTVGLAKKECLVVAGELIVAEARKQGKPLLPIDSEHNAVHQCLRGGRMEEVARIWLTASGGPFRKTPKSEFASITVQQA